MKKERKLSQRAGAFIGETVKEYNKRMKEWDRWEKKLTGGKTFDRETDDFLQEALDNIR